MTSILQYKRYPEALWRTRESRMRWTSTLLFVASAYALDNGLAIAPQMGWVRTMLRFCVFDPNAFLV